MPKDDNDDCDCPPKKKDKCEPCKIDPCEKTPDLSETPPDKESVCKKIQTAREKCKKTTSPPPKQGIYDKFLDRMRSFRKTAQQKPLQKPKVPSALQLQISKRISCLTAHLNKKNLMSAIKCSKDWILNNCDPRKRKMADKAPATPGRPMKYPYTFSAKFAQFPLKYYISNQWIWKYYFVSVAVCLPLFYSINKLANSPGNVAKWAEIRRKEAAEHH